jgi:hypothetical protein
MKSDLLLGLTRDSRAADVTKLRVAHTAAEARVIEAQAQLDAARGELRAAAGARATGKGGDPQVAAAEKSLLSRMNVTEMMEEEAGGVSDEIALAEAAWADADRQCRRIGAEMFVLRANWLKTKIVMPSAAENGSGMQQIQQCARSAYELVKPAEPLPGAGGEKNTTARRCR